MRYRLFNIVLESDVALPGLPVADARPTLFSRRCEASGIVPGDHEPAFAWRSDTGEVVCQVYRDGDGWLFEYPDLVIFRLGHGDTIRWALLEKGTASLAQHLLVNQAIPRLLAQQGQLVLHASAVRVEGQGALAFAGPSGAGKSTLAAYARSQGATLLADDCILLQPGAGGVRCYGAFPGLRLWSGTAGPEAAAQPAHSHSHKWRVDFPGDAIAHGIPLDAIYLLDTHSGESNEVVIETLAGMMPFMALLKGTFSLDPSLEATSVQAFERLGDVLAGSTAVYRLSYPRKHSALANVYRSILHRSRAVKPHAVAL